MPNRTLSAPGATRALLVAIALLASRAIAAEPAPSPADVARKVADRLVADTAFAFAWKPAAPVQQGYATVDLAPSAADDGVYVLVVDAAPQGDADRVSDLQISRAAGRLDVFLDGARIHRSETGRDGTLRKIDYDVVRGDARIKDPFKDGAAGDGAGGARRLALRFAPAGDAWLSLGLTGANGQSAEAGRRLTSPAGASESVFVVAGPLDGEDADALVSALRRGGDLPAAPRGWRTPAAPLYRDVAEGLDLSDWRYFTGTFLTALLDVSARFDGLDYRDYVDRHARFFLSHVDDIAAERRDRHLIDGAFGHYFRFQLLDDVGPQAAALSRWAATHTDDPLAAPADAISRRAADRLMTSVRLADGTFARITPKDKSVWADDLFMGGLGLVALSRTLGEPALLEEAVNQVLLFDKRLRDDASGLYWHGWFANGASGGPSSSKWARANGWTMMAKTEVLAAMPPDHPKLAAVLDVFRRHAEALRAVQTDDGRWSQVLARPDTYLETSATAMFTRAFAAGVAEGWLPADAFAPAARQGWAGLTRQIDGAGGVEGIVRGTPIFFSDEAYNEHQPRANDPRGLGAILYAAIAMDRMAEALAHGSGAAPSEKGLGQ
ncbi:MAG: glycoside hydrolase family 105 protein [Parvularculaceae bacterium]